MQKVSGFGGVLFRAKDPKKLKAWYQENFGVIGDGGANLWQQEAGMTAFVPFAMDNDYFPTTQAVMFNFRIKDLEALLAELKKNGVKIDDKRQKESFGKFAWVYDPEGNKIELWEPTE